MIQKITSNFHSGHLYDVALNAATGHDAGNTDPLIPIVFTALSLEAFINESAGMARTVPTADKQEIVEGFSSVMKELEDRKEAILVKFHMALLVFSGETWREGSQPFQDLKLLLTLRNAIAHMKTDVWSTAVKSGEPDPERSLDSYPKFVQALRQRGLIEKPGNSESWLEVIAQPKVAIWACKTASIVTKEFYQAIPEGHFKDQLEKLVFGYPE